MKSRKKKSVHYEVEWRADAASDIVGWSVWMLYGETRTLREARVALSRARLEHGAMARIVRVTKQVTRETMR